jgi:autotransporter-associated beta strand protein
MTIRDLPRSTGLRRLAAMLAATVAVTALAGRASAADGDWLAAPADGNFNNGANWSTAAAPGAGDTAFFDASAITNVFFTANTTVGGWTFNAGAPAYDFTSNFAVIFDGAGIINGAGLTFSNDNSPTAIVAFANSSTAGTATFINSQQGQVQFAQTSNAGDAVIQNGGGLVFVDSGSAGNATVTNNGLVEFFDDSSGQNSVITNNFFLTFTDNSTAGNATVSTASGAFASLSFFATGAGARFATAAGGTFDISDLFSAGTTAGSIEGGGLHSLGDKNLEIGSNGLDTEVSGVIADGGNGGGVGGSLTKTGAGNFTLSGTNTYTGETEVLGGTLIVNGSIASSSNVGIGAGALVGGTGFLPTVSVGGGGTLAPGNSIGTINVNGDLVFAPGSTYAVEVSPAAADRTNVTGTVEMENGTTVVATYEPGAYVAKKYVIINAAGGLVPGSDFDSLSGTAPDGFVHSLAYDLNNVYLVLGLEFAPGGPIFGGLNQNQQAVAGAISSYFDQAGTLPPAFGALTPADLTLASGEITTGAIGAGFHSADLFVNLLADPSLGASAAGSTLAAYADDKPKASPATYSVLRGTSVSHAADANTGEVFASRWTMWGAAYGGAESIGGSATVGSSDLDARIWGVAAGGDYRLGDGRVGFGLGGGASSFGLSGGLGFGRLGSFNAGLYASQDFGNAYLAGVFGYGFHSTRTSRVIGADLLAGGFNAHTFSGRVEAGYRFAAGAATFVPYAAVQATSFHLPAYAESSSAGTGFALAHAAQTELSARTELGGRAAYTAGGVTLSGRVAWAYNAANSRGVSAAFQTLPGTSFTINGASPARHALLLDAGLEATLAEGLAAKLTFSGEFSRNVVGYGASAKLSYRW